MHCDRPQGCPCSPVSLCEPIRPEKAKVRYAPGGGVLSGGPEVFAFTRSLTNWTAFDWTITTTVAVDAGDMAQPSPAMICLAHSHGARVVVLSGAMPDFKNTTTRRSLVAELVNKTVAAHVDGINLDIESYRRDPASLTLYVKELGEALRAALPAAQLSFDLAIAPKGQMQWYDHRSLAMHADFLVPMAYDENWGSVTPKANSPLTGLTQGLAQYR